MQANTTTNTYNGTNSRVFARFVGPMVEADDGRSVQLNTNFYRLKMLNTLSVSSTITITQIRTGGNDSPVASVRGFRTVAGTFVFVDGFIDAFGPVMEEYLEVVNKYKDNTDISLNRTNEFIKINKEEKDKDDRESFLYNSLWYDVFPNIELLVIIRDNHHDYMKAIAINDVKLRDVGTTISIHDLYTEKTITYVATNLVTTFLPKEMTKFSISDISSIYSTLIYKAGGGTEITEFCHDMSGSDISANIHQMIKDFNKLGRLS